MPDVEKLAIARDGKDLRRIIPFNPQEGQYEFMFTLITFCYMLYKIEVII